MENAIPSRSEEATTQKWTNKVGANLIKAYAVGKVSAEDAIQPHMHLAIVSPIFETIHPPLLASWLPIASPNADRLFQSTAQDAPSQLQHSG